MRYDQRHIATWALVVIIIALSLLAGFTSKSEAQDVAFPSLRLGQPVAVSELTSPHIERAYLLGRMNGQALYRVSVRGQGQCFGAGPGDQIGSIGEFSCGHAGFPTADRPAIYAAVVGADGPPRVLRESDMRLYRLNVIAADTIAAVEVADIKIPVRNNVGSVTFDEGKPLGMVTSFDASGNVVDKYDLRPQK